VPPCALLLAFFPNGVPMKKDFVPTRQDLRLLVERYGSVAHTAGALGVDQHEFALWLSGRKQIPMKYFDTLLTLVANIKGQK